jgi:outer membrane lipoprotein-sorting protein
MKSLIICSTLLAAASLLAAEKDDVKSAAQKLAGSDSYSWTTTMESPQFNPPPSHGKVQKDGLIWLDIQTQDNTIEGLVKDGKGAVKTDDGWKSLDDAAKDDGGGGFNITRFMVTRLRNPKTPPGLQAADIADQTKSLTKAEDVYSGELTEDGAKSLMTMGGRRNGQGPQISNAKGTVKFWVKDGVLTKYQTKVSGTINRNGDDMDVDRTTTVEVKDVGTTKITVPDDAKKKMT